MYLFNVLYLTRRSTKGLTRYLCYECLTFEPPSQGCIIDVDELYSLLINLRLNATRYSSHASPTPRITADSHHKDCIGYSLTMRSIVLNANSKTTTLFGRQSPLFDHLVYIFDHFHIQKPLGKGHYLRVKLIPF